MTKTAAISLANIAAQVSNADAVEFEPLDFNGNPSGIVLLIRSDQHPEVDAGIKRLVDEQRRADQVRAAKAAKARPENMPIATVEDDIENTHRMIALRVVGWKGIEDEFSPENLKRLLHLVPSLGPQILSKSAELGGFTRASSKGS